MKVTDSLLALALALAPITATAYQTAQNIEEAKTKVTDDGIAVVMYARDWDKYSKKTAELMLADPAVTKALGQAIVIRMDVPNVTTKEEHEENKKRFGNLDLSFPNVYPAIVLYDKNNRRLTDICIPFAERKDPAAVAKKVQAAMDAARKQAKLLAQAESASGVDKARLIGQAAAVPGVNRPNDVAKQLKQLDPEDKTGLYEVATLNLFDTAIESAGTKDWEADLARMKKLMANPLLTTFQKQQACCIAIGLLRRHGGMAHKAELKQMLKTLRELDPDSLLGKSAIDAERMWVSNLNLIEGWSPSILPDDATPVELEGQHPIKEAGTYEITFAYTKGTEALKIAGVRICDGDTTIAEDMHAGSTGHKSSNNTYTVKVPAALKKPHVYFIFNMGAKRDSYGRITITKK